MSGEEGLRGDERDFGWRWHVGTAAGVAAALLLLYVLAVKLVLG